MKNKINNIKKELRFLIPSLVNLMTKPFIQASSSLNNNINDLNIIKVRQNNDMFT